MATAVALRDAYRLAMMVMTTRFVEATSSGERIGWLSALKNVFYFGVNLFCGKHFIFISIGTIAIDIVIIH